jgi:site-specific recombinase XerD
VQFAQLSTHWLRHTNATHRLLAGASLETTQDELGHADPKTTRLYVKTLDQQRRADVDKFVKLQQPYAL